jgi:VanZ family protein
LFTVTHLPLTAPLPTVWNLHLFASSDKILHFLAYFGLAILFASWWSWGRKPAMREYLVLAGIILVYAMLEELTQIPFQRSADFFDWLADSCGALLGLLVAFLLWRLGPTWLNYTSPSQLPVSGNI